MKDIFLSIYGDTNKKKIVLNIYICLTTIVLVIYLRENVDDLFLFMTIYTNDIVVLML
mgnify:CR=1 FL=1